jgi:hypothetical protein
MPSDLMEKAFETQSEIKKPNFSWRKRGGYANSSSPKTMFFYGRQKISWAKGPEMAWRPIK